MNKTTTNLIKSIGKEMAMLCDREELEGEEVLKSVFVQAETTITEVS